MTAGTILDATVAALQDQIDALSAQVNAIAAGGYTKAAPDIEFSDQLTVDILTGFNVPNRSHILVFHNVSQVGTPQTPQSLLGMRVSTDGGLTFDDRLGVYFHKGWTMWKLGLRATYSIQASRLVWPGGTIHPDTSYMPITVDFPDLAAYGSSGEVLIQSAGTVAGTPVNTSFVVSMNRTEPEKALQRHEYGGWYDGGPGSRVNAVRFFSPSAQAQIPISGLIEHWVR